LKEFYDHIATGFERSQIQDLQHYIERIVEPDFGGTNGCCVLLEIKISTGEL
jgi:hypothetical protein